MVDSSPGQTQKHYNENNYIEHDRVSLSLKCDFNLNISTSSSSPKNSYEYIKSVSLTDLEKIKSKLKWFKLDTMSLKQLHEYYFKLNQTNTYSQAHLIDIYITSNLDELLMYSNGSKLISNLNFKLKNSFDLISTHGLYLCKFDDSQLLSEVTINGEFINYD